MDEAEVALACLTLAVEYNKSSGGSPVRVIEAAELFYTFVERKIDSD